MMQIEPKFNSSIKHTNLAQQMFLNHDVPLSEAHHHGHQRNEQISHSEKVNRRH
jgi:hypothetical protein